MSQERSAIPWIFAGVGVVLGLVCGLGVLVTSPKINGRSKESEVKTNLKIAFMVERSFFAATDRYDESIDAVGFAPESGNRYRYFFSRHGDSREASATPDGGLHTGLLADTVKFPAADNAALLAGIPVEVLDTAGLEGTCPSCNITIVAAANLDDDETIDV